MGLPRKIAPHTQIEKTREKEGETERRKHEQTEMDNYNYNRKIAERYQDSETHKER